MAKVNTFLAQRLKYRRLEPASDPHRPRLVLTVGAPRLLGPHGERRPVPDAAYTGDVARR